MRFNYKNIVEKCMTIPNVNDQMMLENILLKFGQAPGGVYILPEHEDGRHPCFGVCEAIDLAFGIDHGFDTILDILFSERLG